MYLLKDLSIQVITKEEVSMIKDKEKDNKSKRVVILGAGLIGCEFANDLIESGHEVEVVDLTTVPMSSHLPESKHKKTKA